MNLNSINYRNFKRERAKYQKLIQKVITDDWVNEIKKQTDPFGNSKKTGFSGLSKHLD